MPKKPTWATPKAPKAVKELFKAKKEVTEKDVKKLKPLTKWLRKVQKADNLEVFFLGFTAGACALFIVHVLSV